MNHNISFQILPQESNDALVITVDVSKVSRVVANKMVEEAWMSPIAVEARAQGRKVFCVPSWVSISTLKIVPGDAIVGTVNIERMTPTSAQKWMESIKDRMKEVFPDNKILIMTQHLSLQAQSTDEGDHE